MLKHLAVLACCLMIAVGVNATVAPKNGGRLPEAYYRMKAADRTAFTTKRAWMQKVQRIKRQREAYLEAQGPNAVSALPSEYAVSGTIAIPVMLVEYANRPATKDSTALQNTLFDNPSGTVTDYYDEVSYSNLNMTGTVYRPVTLSQNDYYYEGTSNGLVTGDAFTGQLILETLTAKDPMIDFGQYDNDGPDGVPNSGDDDGVVDVIAFVHPEIGGECGSNANIWSHRWVYSGWPESGGLPFVTDDPGASGGFIWIDDYAIMPALSCAGGGTIIEIGVYCHEFGHAMGLPDLYDTNGGGYGLGVWAIMSSGNWNQPSSPAHPCAWTRKEMGWVVPTDVGWQGSVQTINRINTNAQCYRLAFTDDYFRRSTACAINGSYSLYCGLTAAEGTTRGWASPGPNGGYGNGWRETIEREFTYDGTGPVNFSYAYSYDTEPGFDYAYAIIDVEGTENVLAAYNGIGSSTANHNISAYLSVLSPGSTYKLKFRAVSDYSWSDEDGFDPSNCGLIAIDDISVTGGGESYSTGFETYVDGWHQSPGENPAKEYWLVENRQRVGFDSNLRATGLLIMHADDNVMKSIRGNSGGGTGITTRGLVLEEADGNFNLNNPISSLRNTGDTGDPFPGSTNNTAFDSLSTPNSNDNLGRPTRIAVTNISASSAAMSAFMKAGDPAPWALSVSPNDEDNNKVALDITVSGDFIKHGATFYFTNPTGTASEAADASPLDSEDIVATSLVWVDPVRLKGTVNIYSKTGGNWDLVVTNPDGQSYTLDDALHLNFIVAARLASAAIDVVEDGVRLEYVLRGREEGETIRLYRSTVAEGRWTRIVDDLQPSTGGSYVYVDRDVEPGRTYFYRLESRLSGGEVNELHRGGATVPARDIFLSQNFPNPFNPTTSISFYLPERTKLRLEIFDVQGKLVDRVAAGTYDVGPHRVSWDGTDMNGNPASSGVYVYRLTAGKHTMSKKMILLK